MKSNASLVYNIFLVLGDFLALVGAFGSAYVMRVSLDSRPLVEPIPALTYIGAFLTLLPLWIIIFGLLGLYDNTIYEKRFSELGRLFLGSFIGMLFVISYAYIVDKPLFPARLVPVYGFGFAFLFLVLFRNLARAIRNILFYYDIGITNLLIIGDNTMARELASALGDSRHSGYRVIGIVHGQTDTGTADGIPRYDTFEHALNALGVGAVHSIVQTKLYTSTDQNAGILELAQKHHISYRFIPGHSELFVGNLSVDLFRSSFPVISVHQTPLLGWGRVGKRIFDIVVSLVMILCLSPVYLILGLLVFIFSPGPIFFSQKRITRFGKSFRMYKFRSIRPAYNGLTPEQAFQKMGKPDLTKQYREHGDQLPHDPRFTPIGRLLRRTSLDELPQLFNVLKGDISLVGPRALIPEEINAADAKHHIVSVKSGITGLAQVSGRRDIGYDERRKLDLYYVQNWSFWLDVIILIKTIRVVFERSGAK